MPFRFLLFDLDETLYPRDAGVMQGIHQRIRQYIMEMLGLTWEEADALASRYFQLYGTSMRGLLIHHDLNTAEFLAYVHDLPLEQLLAPQPALNAMLAELPGEKVIFTNADRCHAERVTERLGIRQHFSRIIDIEALNFISKPNLEAYLACLRLLEAAPQDCVLIDDSARNLAPARQLGMATILVDGDATAAADAHIREIMELTPALERLNAR